MKTLYVAETLSVVNLNFKHIGYWFMFRGKLYPVYPVDSLLVHKKLDNTDEIYMFYDNGKIKRLGKLGDYNVRPLAEFYRGLGYNV